MALLIVSAIAAELFADFLMLVSVTTADGVPVKKLTPVHFKVNELADINHSAVTARSVTKVREGPDGFYMLMLAEREPILTVPNRPFRVIFAVSVTGLARVGGTGDHGQTVALGDLTMPAV
jgi:hypothetical protein